MIRQTLVKDESWRQTAKNIFRALSKCGKRRCLSSIR